jgi:hypothetical protein
VSLPNDQPPLFDLDSESPHNFEHLSLRQGKFVLKVFLAVGIVVEQLARLAVKNPEHLLAQECIALLSPMLEGLVAILFPLDEDDTVAAGPLAPELTDFPEDNTVGGEVTFAIDCLLFALYYLKTGWVG